MQFGISYLKFEIMNANKRDRTFTRDQIKRALDRGDLIFQTLRKEDSRAQIDDLQRKQFGPWSDVFASMERCRGRVLLCLLGGTVIGYQAFEPFASRGNPYSPEHLVMRLTFVFVREDSLARARGLGLGTELVKRTLDLAWQRGFDAVYAYATAYELMLKGGLRSHGGEEILSEGIYVRDFDPDQAPPLLFVMERPGKSD